jgi:hypothetical protein
MPTADNVAMGFRQGMECTRRRLGSGAILVLATLLAGCGGKSSTAPGLPPRTFMMGFSGNPPRPDINVLIQAIQMWSKRADAALILNEPPWDSLLAGVRPDSMIVHNQLQLANFYRGLGLRVIVSIDPGNGLDRSTDSAELLAAGRSMTEPAIQHLYRQYVTAMDSIIHPDYLGVASETNLIRAASPAPLYHAIVLAADSAAYDVRARGSAVPLFTTVQVDMAWGRLLPPGTWVGIDQDRADFAFDQVLGLSSYPYLAGFTDPDSLPSDYYSRLDQGSPIPMMVIEGGWTSLSFNSISSTPDKQRRYIRRQMTLLDNAAAIGVFQITFTDIDLASVPPPNNVNLIPFAYTGLVDANLVAKPALSEWDAAFKRPRH